MPVEPVRKLRGYKHSAKRVAYGFTAQGLLFFLRARTETGVGGVNGPGAEHPADSPGKNLLHHNKEDNVENDVEDSSH